MCLSGNGTESSRANASCCTCSYLRHCSLLRLRVEHSARYWDTLQAHSYILLDKRLGTRSNHRISFLAIWLHMHVLMAHSSEILRHAGASSSAKSALDMAKSLTGCLWPSSTAAKWIIRLLYVFKVMAHRHNSRPGAQHVSQNFTASVRIDLPARGEAPPISCINIAES